MKTYAKSNRWFHLGANGQSLFRSGFLPVLVWFLVVVGFDRPVTAADSTSPRKGLVATVNPVATEAGL